MISIVQSSFIAFFLNLDLSLRFIGNQQFSTTFLQSHLLSFSFW